MNEAAYLMHFTKTNTFLQDISLSLLGTSYLKYMYLTLSVSVNKYCNYWVKLGIAIQF